MAQAPVAALRRFIGPRQSQERCDACGAPLPAEHIHQFDPATHRIRCACGSCAALCDTTYREIPKRVIALPDFQISDAQWDGLMIPISLAFFSFQTPVNRIVALYPGPAGAAESSLRLETWQEIAEANIHLREMQPDVEALLVNRVGQARDYFIVPIDECYKLVGLIRLHWRGLSGGALVWGEIGRFFEDLNRRACPCPV
jgi:hypothetical protein